jgi:hypothetical protein
MTATARTAAALRMLLAAWCADPVGLPQEHNTWLMRQLVDPRWVPSPSLRARIAPRFLAWAQHRDIPEIARRALEGQ